MLLRLNCQNPIAAKSSLGSLQHFVLASLVSIFFSFFPFSLALCVPSFILLFVFAVFWFFFLSQLMLTFFSCFYSRLASQIFPLNLTLLSQKFTAVVALLWFRPATQWKLAHAICSKGAFVCQKNKKNTNSFFFSIFFCFFAWRRKIRRTFFYDHKLRFIQEKRERERAQRNCYSNKVFLRNCIKL